MIDLHTTSEGLSHVLVDAEGMAILRRHFTPLRPSTESLVDPAILYGGTPIYVDVCPCPHSVPPHAAVTLLGCFGPTI